MPEQTPEALLTVQKDAATRMGGDRIRLLEAIDQEGSISGAARRVGLSYKAAWDGVNAMNNLFKQPLVTGQTGGRHGGGAALTAAGRQVLSAFGRMQSGLRQYMQELQASLDGSIGNTDTPLLWSMMMKTSSRNTFLCNVSQIHEGTVNAEVELSLADGQSLVAVITRQSVSDLGLTAGGSCYALIKSSFVILAEENAALRTSARNRLCGTVTSHEDGEVSSEICLDLGGGKTLVAVITRDSAQQLALAPGDRACALIKASHVILAV